MSLGFQRLHLFVDILYDLKENFTCSLVHILLFLTSELEANLFQDEPQIPSSLAVLELNREISIHCKAALPNNIVNTKRRRRS